jgi:hypothetical protein
MTGLELQQLWSPASRKSLYPLRYPSSVERVFRVQADWTVTHTSHKNTEQRAIEAFITLDGVTLTAGSYQSLLIRCSGGPISTQTEHSA